jgi:quercetin dioxygenase-like cupin family protein
MVFRWQDATPVEMLPGLVRRTLAVGDRAMVAEFRGQAGVVIAEHSHPQEQVGYVVSGNMAIIIAGVENVVRPGDSYAIGGGVPHGARFLTDLVVVEAFAPPRDDYRT